MPKTARKRPSSAPDFYRWTNDPKAAYGMILELAFEFAHHKDIPKPWPNEQLTPDLAMRELERVVAHWSAGEDAIPGVPPKIEAGIVARIVDLGSTLGSTGLDGIVPHKQFRELLQRMSRVPRDKFYWDAYHLAVNLYKKSYYGTARGRPRKITSEVVKKVENLRAAGKSRGEIACILGREGYFADIRNDPEYLRKAADRMRHWPPK